MRSSTVGLGLSSLALLGLLLPPALAFNSLPVPRRLALLSPLLYPFSSPAPAGALTQPLSPLPLPPCAPKTILITGATSGIGLAAALRLAPAHKLYLPGRTLASSLAARAELLAADPRIPGGNLVAGECDVADLGSVEKYAGTLPGDVDVVCLNAGLALNTKTPSPPPRTADGFELTLGTNHFGHFRLLSLLAPSLPRSSRVVITASSVHDPATAGGKQGAPATLGDLRGLREQGRSAEMLDGGPFNADKAYKDSKLANVLFAREAARRLPNPVNCFTPGLITTSNFFRDQSPFFTLLFGFFANNVLRVAETPEWGGAALAYLALMPEPGTGQFFGAPPGASKDGVRAFGTTFVAGPPSREARDDELAKELWELSEKVTR